MRLQERVEQNTGLMLALTLLVVSIGGMVEIVPIFFQQSTMQPAKGVVPYSAIQLSGRDIYIREGCVSCHSQMVRPFRAETERYGPFSTAGEFTYERPFLWGSKRTGPDLARVGQRYSDEWHRVHLINPRDVVPESIMPSYPWLETSPLDATTLPARMTALKNLGVPYSEEEIASAQEEVAGKTEMDALIAYLQVLGTAVKKNESGGDHDH